MKLLELLQLCDETFGKCYSTIKDKNNDYSKEDDALDNFKKQSIICEALGLNNSPKAQAMRLLILKIIRITNLWKKPKINFESLEDTIIDLINYAILVEGCRKDEKI